MIHELIPPIITGVVTGLIAWGGIRVELKWLRRDVDWAHSRLDKIETICRTEHQHAP